MKTFNGQTRQSALRPSNVTVRRTLRKLSAKNISGGSVACDGEFRDVLTPAKQKAHIPCLPMPCRVRKSSRSKNALHNEDVLKHSSDFVSSALLTGHAFPERTVELITNQHVLSVDTGGFSPLLLLAHPAAIVYITSCQPDHHMIYVSPQIARLGFSAETCFGKPDIRLQRIYEEDAGLVRQAFGHSCNSAESFSCHYRLYDSNGKVRWFHDEASVVCDSSGVPLFIRGVMVDITDKKELEAELAKHRYYLELNVEQRTAQLVKRMNLLESCNSALCDKLALARKHLTSLNQQLQQALPESVLAEINIPGAV